MVCATVFALGTARADSASDEWRIVEATVLDFAFTNTAVDLNGYHSIISDPLTIWYSTDAEIESANVEDSIEQFRARFAAIFQARFAANGLEIIDSARTGALRLHVEIVDLKVIAPIAEINPWADQFFFETRPGHMTLIGEIQDAWTGEVLLRIADLEKTAATGDAVWSQVQTAFDSWSDNVNVAFLAARADYPERTLAQFSP